MQWLPFLILIKFLKPFIISLTAKKGLCHLAQSFLSIVIVANDDASDVVAP